MKIGNKPLGKRASKVVKLTRGEEVHEFTLVAFPLGFIEVVLQERLPHPIAPRNYIKDANGALMKDRDGFPALEQAWETIPLRKARTKILHLQGIAMVYEGLREDKTVSWDTPQPTGDNWVSFYEAIQNEMIQAGLTAGELTFLLNEVRGISQRKQKDMEDKRDDFLSEASPPTGGNGASHPTPSVVPSSI